MPANTDVNVGYNVNYSLWFNGNISNVSIYNRALTPSEIKLLYERPQALTERRPSYYPLTIVAPPVPTIFRSAWAQYMNNIYHIGNT